jgi:MFS family permease
MTTIAQTKDRIAGRKTYLIFLIVLMGMVAIMDQYLSTVKSSALPFLLEEYGIEAAEFSYLEAVFLAATFLVFLLNGLNDIIGRKYAILILVLIMGLASLGIVLFTPSIHLFMIFYTLVIFTTVSNMWAIPIGEEAPAPERAKLVSVVFVIGLIPLQAILPPLIVDRWGLDWRWMFGIMFIFMLPVLFMWLFMRETGRFTIIRQERQLGIRKKHLYGLGVIDRRDLRFIAFSALIWFCWLVNSLLYYWAGYYFMTLKGYTLSQWSMILLGMLVLAMAGGVTGGWIMDRLGRRLGLVIGCFGMMLSLVFLGFAEGMLMNILAILSGFFSALTYTWIVVYIPEVFPTERRGACMGWTTTLARVSYVVGPALAGILLDAFPAMDWFWVVAGLIMLLPVGIVLAVKPYETRTKELEEIEVNR